MYDDFGKGRGAHPRSIRATGCQSKYFLSMTQLDTRTRIIREAARMFADDGIKATTIAKLEQAVGLRSGSGGVHRYFATKDDLVRAVLGDQLARGEASHHTAQTWPLPAPGQVEDFLKMMGLFVLHESQHGREVALIGLREGRAVYAKFPELRNRNFELAFMSTAAQIRAFQGQAEDSPTNASSANGHDSSRPCSNTSSHPCRTSNEHRLTR
jgi:AcrR family transcriptional regulator